MTQVSLSTICDCCGLLIKPGSGDICPRCNYPLNVAKEERFLESSIRDLQRVAYHGGANLTISSLIARYQSRLTYLRGLAGVLPLRPAALQPAPTLPQETKEPGKLWIPPVVPQKVEPQVSSVPLLEKPSAGIPATKPSGAQPAALPGTAGARAPIPPQALPPAKPLAGTPVPSQMQISRVEEGKTPSAVVATEEPQRPPRRVFSFSLRSFVVDQAITLIGLLGAFLILMGALRTRQGITLSIEGVRGEMV
jgi:hypothetical protein